MAANTMPLYYAIMNHFLNTEKDCAQGVMAELAADYSGYKLFTLKDVSEALATAKENRLLDELECDLDEGDNLMIFYSLNEFGRDMVTKYIG